MGLIGGSMSVDIGRRGFASATSGVEAEPVNAAAAAHIGIVDRVVDYEECIAQNDLIILAVPVGAAVRMLPDILDRFAAEGASCRRTVIDVCSTKSALSRAVQDHPMRSRYVATHPMAGTEYSGPWAAMSGLFDSNACIICNADKSAHDAIAVVERLYDTLNMRLIYMDAEQHDMHAAYVSHISHVTSFALALTVLDKERDDKHIFDLASGGFSSTARLAKSNADMWVPILSQNKDNVLQVIDTYIDKMQAFRDAISASDEESIRGLINEANRIKRIIK